MTDTTDSTVLEGEKKILLENQVSLTTQQDNESCPDIQVASTNVLDSVETHMLPVKVPFNVQLCREPVTNAVKDGLSGFSKHHNVQWRAGNLETKEHTCCESNTNLVQWSDGSWTFVINDAYYYCDIQNKIEYFSETCDKETLICNTITEQKITLRPLSLGTMSTCNTKVVKTTRLKPIIKGKGVEKHETRHTSFSHDKQLNSNTLTTSFLENDEL